MSRKKSKVATGRPMDSLGSLLTKSLMKKGFSATVKLSDIKKVWEDALGGKIAENAQPYMIKKGLLFLKCKNSTWMQELALLKEELKNAINGKLGKEEVKDMKFRIAEMDAPQPDPETTRPKELKPIKVDLPPEVEAEIDAKLSEVTSPEIKRALKTLMARGYMEEVGNK